MAQKNSITIFGKTIAAGSQHTFHIPIGQLYTQTDIAIPVQVVNGKRPGPVLLVCAAIHGDELNGIEIIRRVLSSSWLKNIKGTLIAVPVVNVLGVIHRSRYLPDRRDLNRCFPGSETGSLGARIAHLFVNDILAKCHCAVDLHTGAIHRANIPQIRVNLENEKAKNMAHAFGVPLVIDAPIRDGSLRGAGDDLNIPIITYEAGEALRFDESSILAGMRGIRNVMVHLAMLPARNKKKKALETFVAKTSNWVRAPADGLYRTRLTLGDRVKRGELIGMVDGPLGGSETEVIAPFSGIIIGATNLPLVNEGEALVHIARFDDIDEVESSVDEFREEMDSSHLPL